MRANNAAFLYVLADFIGAHWLKANRVSLFWLVRKGMAAKPSFCSGVAGVFVRVSATAAQLYRASCFKVDD